MRSMAQKNALSKTASGTKAAAAGAAPGAEASAAAVSPGTEATAAMTSAEATAHPTPGRTPTEAAGAECRIGATWSMALLLLEGVHQRVAVEYAADKIGQHHGHHGTVGKTGIALIHALALEVTLQAGKLLQLLLLSGTRLL